MSRRSTQDKGPGDRILGDAVAAWKSGERPEERLSDEARGRIVRAAVGGARRQMAPLGALFLPGRWWVLAGGLPLVLTAALLLVVELPAPPGSPMTELQVTKRDGEVVFTIANGRTEHLVYTSTVPHRFERASAVRVRGEFVDRVERGGDLVFYKID